MAVTDRINYGPMNLVESNACRESQSGMVDLTNMLFCLPHPVRSMLTASKQLDSPFLCKYPSEKSLPP